jgi:hypothetical protein
MHDFFMVVLSLFYTGCIVDILMWIQKNVVQNLFYWENFKILLIVNEIIFLRYFNHLTGQGDIC